MKREINMGILTEYCALLRGRGWIPETPLSALLFLLAFVAMCLGVWTPFIEKVFESKGLRIFLRVVLFTAAFILLCAVIAEEYRAKNS